MKLAPHDPYVV